MTQVVFYTKQDCGLCEKARQVLERMRRRLSFTVVEVDIEQDKEAYAKYWDAIPVVIIDGETKLMSWITDEALEQALRRSGKR